jgi:acyl carrier protein
MVLQADVSQHEDVARVLETMTASLPPLRGVIHAAGVLEDGVLLQQSWRRFDAVMAPKVVGAWNLHTLTREMALDFFVCFSSAASLLGSRGQGNYAAANAFLDALAYHRRHQGLPGLSINWGPWADVGMAAEMDHRAKRRMQEQGWEPISPEQGLRILGELLAQNLSQVGVLPLTWPRFLEQFPTGTIPSYFAAWTAPAVSVGQEEPSSAQQRALLQILRDVSASDRRRVLIEYLQDRVARIVGLAPGHPPPPQQLFSELGLDSLMHMELRNHITTDLDVNVPMADFITSPNIASLTELLLEYLALASVALAEYASLDHDDDEMEEITL